MILSLNVAAPGERQREEPGETFRFRPLTQVDAEAIALWHYPEPFSFYDWAEDPDDLAELLDSALRGDAYVAVERAGFARVRVFMHATNGGEWQFVETQRPA